MALEDIDKILKCYDAIVTMWTREHSSLTEAKWGRKKKKKNGGYQATTLEKKKKSTWFLVPHNSNVLNTSLYYFGGLRGDGKLMR